MIWFSEGLWDKCNRLNNKSGWQNIGKTQYPKSNLFLDGSVNDNASFGSNHSVYANFIPKRKNKQIVQFIWFTNASNLVCDMVRNRHGSFDIEVFSRVHIHKCKSQVCSQ